MTTILLVIGFIFVLTLLFCRYELKKGQIKMRDNEIPVEKVIFEEDYNIHELF